jgi:putative hemolysin
LESFEPIREYAGTIATSIVVVIVTFLSIIFGELIPKKFGLIRAEKISRLVAGPMNILSKIMHPFVWMLSGSTNLIFKVFNISKASDSSVTEEEIKAMISEGSEHGTIEEGEKDIIERVFHLGDRSITSLMTHRTDIVWVDAKDSVETFKSKFAEVVYSTFPVCDGSIDDIKGACVCKRPGKSRAKNTIGRYHQTSPFCSGKQ